MKLLSRIGMIAALAAVALAIGCAFEADVLGDADSEADAVWLETAKDGGVLLAVLPSERGAGVVTETLAEPPTWYVGPGVYLPDGESYVLWMDGAALTLDDVLMTWDPRPGVSE